MCAETDITSFLDVRQTFPVSPPSGHSHSTEAPVSQGMFDFSFSFVLPETVTLDAHDKRAHKLVGTFPLPPSFAEQNDYIFIHYGIVVTAVRHSFLHGDSVYVYLI